VPGTVTIWKDWTLVGFDITPYHGQRILVRLTTRDCDEGGHYGYAYYHLKCGSKNLISSTCGYVDSNTFIAPIGFNYRWYSSANPSVTLSTERRLDAVVDSNVNYHCLVSSTENPSCTFLYTAYGGYRYPLSQLDYSYTWQPCSFTIDFTNLSTISADGITPAGTGERCETTKWVFPDGDTITTLNAVKTFSDTSEIKVRLISGIANDQCVDILDTIIKLERPYPNLNIFGDSVVCKNDTAVLFANHTGLSFWSNQDTTNSISFIPLIDTIYSLELIDSLGCYHIDSINIKVNPRDTTYITAEICDNQMYTSNGFNTNSPGIHELKLISKNNCDSTVYLNLTVHPTYNDTIYAEICNGTIYNLNGFNDSITGLYTLSLQTTKGCDSIVNLNLSVNPTYNDTINAIICEGETYTDNGFYENITGIYTQNLVTYKGCDSIVNLNLIVGHKYNDTILADICDNQMYTSNGFNTNSPGIHELKLISKNNCDSTLYLNLTVHPTYNDTIYAEICNGTIYNLNGFNDSITGLYTLSLQTTKGCDSIVNLNLSVNPTYNDTINAIICEGETYTDNGFYENITGIYTQNLVTYKGCDSIVNLNLIVGHKYNDTILADICLGEAYNDFGFNETQEGFYTHPFLSQYGCDSIVNLSLLVHNPYFDTIIDTICQGDIYEYGFDADSTGTYIQNLQTTFGCDSILVLHLQVNPVYHDTIKADIYKGNVYNQHGFNEKETGVYTRELKTYLGCDSIIYLDLQVDNVLFSNVVTPNGDGINDVFKLNNLVEQDAFPENELIIFNRQGKMIYQKKNIKIDTDFWDPEQTKTPNGTYFFRFIGTRYDKKIDKVGAIEVLR
jgi:gliding motility-associated-like protein